jgi:hypothetical protein
MDGRARLSWIAAAAALAFSGAAARGQPAPAPSGAASAEVDGCLTAFADAQRLRREGALRAAHQALISCSQPACPELIVARCTPWLREVAASIPSIIPLAKDGDGRDLVAVRVRIDGAPLTEVLDGRPIEVDPGPHELVFEAPGHPPVAIDVVMAEGQKSRLVEVRIGADVPPPVPKPPPALPRPATPPDEGLGVSPWAWVGFGVGAAAFIAAGVTGGLALARARDLEDTCGGTTCSDAQLDAYDEGVALANASTGLLVAGGFATAFGVVALLWLGDASIAAVYPVLGPGYGGLGARF